METTDNNDVAEAVDEYLDGLECSSRQSLERRMKIDAQLRTHLEQAAGEIANLFACGLLLDDDDFEPVASHLLLNAPNDDADIQRFRQHYLSSDTARAVLWPIAKSDSAIERSERRLLAFWACYQGIVFGM